MRNISAYGTAGTEKLNLAIQKSKRRNAVLPALPLTSTVLFSTLPLPQMQASVIVPVKNEEGQIESTLNALRLQTDLQGNAFPHEAYEVLLLANNCTDNTVGVAKAYQRLYPTFRLHIAEIYLDKKDAHIGTARRMLMDEAFRRHGINGYDGVILSTDGDTEADERWIASTLHEINNGCDAVGGRILTHRVVCDSRLYHLRDTAYRYLAARLEAALDPAENDPWPRHFQCFGASMAVRCSVYQKAGRLPVIPFLEDEAFSRALNRVDAKIRKSPSVKVYTSARLTGRVKVGLSAHLTHLANLKKQCLMQYVEAPELLVKKFTLRNELRQCWLQRKKKAVAGYCVGKIAVALGVSQRWLLREMDMSGYFGELWEKAEQKLYAANWEKKHPPVRIDDAIRQLRLQCNEKMSA